MITIAVFDNDPSNRENIRDLIVKFSVQNQTDLDVLWFFERFDNERIHKVAQSIHVALISLDLRESRRIARLLYRYNEDCRIVFYSSALQELEPLLCFRPRAFFVTSEESMGLYQKMDDIIAEIKCNNHFFCHESKRGILLIPLSTILYFQSDLKYVNIVLSSGKNERIFAKLSAVEPGLNSDFIRIHKSYVINRRFVRFVNKSEKLIVLNNDQQLPISDVHYKTVVSVFCECSI